MSGWVPSLSLLERKDKIVVVLLHPGFKCVTEIDTVLKRRFVSFKVTPSNEKVYVFMPLEGITPESSWLGGISLKDFNIIWEMKVMEMKKE